MLGLGGTDNVGVRDSTASPSPPHGRQRSMEPPSVAVYTEKSEPQQFRKIFLFPFSSPPVSFLGFAARFLKKFAVAVHIAKTQPTLL